MRRCAAKRRSGRHRTGHLPDGPCPRTRRLRDPRAEQLSSAGYGAALPEDATDTRSFVNTVLTDLKSEARAWLNLYEKWLAPVANRTEVNAPDLTLEEAATLWPRELE